MSSLAKLPKTTDRKIALTIRRNILDYLERSLYCLSSDVTEALLNDIYVDLKTMVVYKEMEDDYEAELKRQECGNCGCNHEG